MILMKMQAEVVCYYGDNRLSKAVAEALGPDNLKLPKGLRVSTKSSEKAMVSEIEMDGRMETLLATLDDLLSCTLAAEIVL